jgi:exportin-2 (importin alpha re-exporter)
VHDHEAFLILNSIIENVSSEKFIEYFPKILTIIFSRIQKLKQTKFLKCTILFFSLFVLTYSPDLLIKSIEGLQKGLFNMFCKNWFHYSQKITGKKERDLVSLSIVKIITGSELIYEESLFGNWISFLFTFLKILELPEDTTNDEDDIGNDDEKNPMEYKVKFNKLSFASTSNYDITKKFPSAKIHFVKCLNERLSNNKFSKILSNEIKKLPNEAQEKIASYFKEFNLSLNF